jgi:RNA polymerase sigma-54 factor
MKDDNYPEMDDSKVLPIKNEVSFYELLINQLGMLDLDERNLKLPNKLLVA